jgi:hypothetical protein
MLPTLLGWNKDRDSLARFNAVMEAPPEFEVQGAEP